jgi:hypothetical protein
MVNKSEDYKYGLTGVHSKYDSEPNLSSYRTSDKQFPNPDGIHVFEGFGADAKDLERGWVDPLLDDKPEYDKDNYVERWSRPCVSDLVEGGPGMNRDYEFRNKERVSKGFLTRPRIPTER